MTVFTMDLHDLDLTLSGLRGAADAVGSNLLELEADPTYQALQHALLVGTSGEQWAEAQAALAEVWHGHTLLTSLLLRADARRHGRARLNDAAQAELAQLLTGPSIELDRTRVPVAQRDLFTLGQSTTTCTPDELLSSMAGAFRRVQMVVNAVAIVWNEFAPRLAATRERLVGLEPAAAALDAVPDELLAAQTHLRELAQRAFSDPFTVTDADIMQLEADAAAAHEVVAGSRSPAVRREELRGRLDAYRVMAHARGLDEDEATDRGYDAARQALHRVPTNLDRVEELVREYQHLLMPARLRNEGLR